MDIDLKNLTDECNTVEYKQAETDTLYKTVSAFANTDGGCIILGVTDDKEIVGIDLCDNKQEQIVNKIADNTGILPNVELAEIDGKQILKITIDKSSNPIAYRGRYYKRVGNTSREIPKEELKTLFLKNVSWDSQTNKCTIDDIDEETVRKFINKAIKEDRIIEDVKDYTVEDILTHLELIIDDKYTNASILLFGKNPQKLFRNATVRIGLFKGNYEDTIISDKEITGNLFNQVQETENAIKSLINKRAEIKDFERKDIWDYPIVALREAILNALIHRDYFDISANTQIKIFDDCIWFYNTGELFGGLTIEQLNNPHHSSKSRNPLLMNVMYKAKLVEQFGTGINRMNVACLKQGIPTPKLDISSSGFVLTMDKGYKNINDRQKVALEYVVQNEYITNGIYQEINNCSRDISKRDLKKLVDLGIFEMKKVKDTFNYSIKIK
ncbi:putative DNA binding domain-containing protein [bacterium]|nr:putative DNA binding domain-containing protein [bacterium]